ncbi:MAG: DUF2142 domain-containing protein [Dactylosporangium sp.]|nr:DUF2142 domain-containing protein [Dactylosporangium sp.]NNJ63736.1 DUF2142 domain-containing protein [Dactylosporangium sp.]
MTGPATAIAYVRARLARGGATRSWALAFVAFFLAIGAWSIAAPYNAIPDEQDHIIRAAGVVSGQIAPDPTDAVRGSGAFQTVPAGLIRDDGCWMFDSTVSAACAPGAGSDRTLVEVGSGAGRYHPAYYAIVGLPLRLLPGWPGVILARLISAALTAALLAGALVTILRHSRHRLMLAGLLVAATPMVGFLGGAINPNGVEIAAGIGFFTAGIVLLLGGSGLAGAPERSSGLGDAARRAASTTGVVWLAGLSAVALAMLRTTGLLFLAFGLLALLVPASMSRLRALWRTPAIRWWCGVLTVTVITSVSWIILMRTSDLGDFNPGGITYSPSQAVLLNMSLWPGYFDEMVGVTGWLDTRMAAPAYMIWESAAAFVVILALVFGSWRDRWRMFVVFTGGFLLPLAVQIRATNTVGFITQGRYLLPMLAGVALLAGFVIEERGSDALPSRRIIRLLTVTLLPIHLICLVYTMVRWQNGLPVKLGITMLNPFADADWSPPLGSWLPIVAEVAGLLLLGYLAWTRAARPVPPRDGTGGVEDRPGRAPADLVSGEAG